MFTYIYFQNRYFTARKPLSEGKRPSSTVSANNGLANGGRTIGNHPANSKQTALAFLPAAYRNHEQQKEARAEWPEPLGFTVSSKLRA